jgi:hypothetical protein
MDPDPVNPMDPDPVNPVDPDPDSDPQQWTLPNRQKIYDSKRGGGCSSF